MKNAKNKKLKYTYLRNVNKINDKNKKISYYCYLVILFLQTKTREENYLLRDPSVTTERENEKGEESLVTVANLDETREAAEGRWENER